MKIELTIKESYETRYNVVCLETITESMIDRKIFFWDEETYTYYKQFIKIYKHKTFGYISAFNTNYRKERFQ